MFQLSKRSLGSSVPRINYCRDKSVSFSPFFLGLSFPFFQIYDKKRRVILRRGKFLTTDRASINIEPNKRRTRRGIYGYFSIGGPAVSAGWFREMAERGQ